MNTSQLARWHAGLLGAALLSVSLASWAEAPEATPPAWSFGVIAGHAVDSNLFDIIPQSLGGDLQQVNSRFYGVLVRRDLPPPAWLSEWGVSTSVEVTLGRATGEAHNTDLAIDWRPSISLWHFSAADLEFAWGFGYLHSFGKPWSDYVDPDHPNGYRNFVHMAPEIGLRFGEQREWSLGLRIHHRSGMYGLLAPRRVGANYPAVTLVRRF